MGAFKSVPAPPPAQAAADGVDRRGERPAGEPFVCSCTTACHGRRPGSGRRAPSANVRSKDGTGCCVATPQGRQRREHSTRMTAHNNQAEEQRRRTRRARVVHTAWRQHAGKPLGQDAMWHVLTPIGPMCPFWPLWCKDLRSAPRAYDANSCGYGASPVDQPMAKHTTHRLRLRLSDDIHDGVHPSTTGGACCMRSVGPQSDPQTSGRA